MKKTLQLAELSRQEMICTAIQVQAILDDSVESGFIAPDNELYIQLRVLTAMSEYLDSGEIGLSVCDLVPIDDSALPIGFYFEHEFTNLTDEEKTNSKFWFTAEELLAVLRSLNYPN